MADETRTHEEAQRLSIRPSLLTAKQIDRLMLKLGTKNKSEVVRRAVQHFERCVDADAVFIVEAGEKSRVLLD